MHFDARQFALDRFKSPQGVIAFLRSYGVSELPKEATVYKWLQRGNIPTEWFALLLAYLEIDDGVPPTIQKYLRQSR